MGLKGLEVNDAKGKRLEDFTQEELTAYGGYCVNDVELTYKLFKELDATFPVKEKRLIDITIRMFSEPLLELDAGKLETHLAEVRARKDKLFIESGITKEVLNTLLAVVLILILAFLSQQIVRYLNYVAMGKIPTSVLVRLVAFEVPYLFALLLPLGLYLGEVQTSCPDVPPPSE